MIWQNPWAWLGLLALGIPVLIHLLGRRNARITRFPTLRFVEATRLMATRRTRLSDLALLAVRMGVIGAAAAAMAMPLLLTDGRQREHGRSVSRAIIVDTSRSMQRMASGGAAGESALQRARVEAQRLASEGQTSVIVETATPSDALDGAVGWLDTRRGQQEVVIISDFQRGAVDSVDRAAIPAGVGVGLIRIDVEPAGGPVELTTRQGVAEIIARVAADSVRTRVEWTTRRAVAATGPDPLVVLVSERERALAAAAREAARSVALPIPGDRRPMAIVHGGATAFPDVMRAVRPPAVPWQADVMARLRVDPMLADAALVTDLPDDVIISPGPDPSPYLVIARNADGLPVVLATTGVVDGVDRVILSHIASAGSLLSTAVIAAANRAASDARVVAELEPSTIPESMLAGWRRPSASAPSGVDAGGDTSDGRWFWLLALTLLGLETWMRRARRESAAQEVVHDRAA